MVENINILEIDKKIRDDLSAHEDEINAIQAKIELMEKIKANNISDRISRDLDDNISQLQIKLTKMTQQHQLGFYIMKSGPILQRFREILATPVVTSFDGGKPKSNREKKKLIKEYLQIATKYTGVIYNIEKPRPLTKCSKCKSKDLIFDDNYCVCAECGLEQEYVSYMMSYKDTERVNITNKYAYQRKIHFKECIKQYQAKQNCTIKPEVYTKLEEILDRHHLLDGDSDTPREVRFARVTKENIIEFLGELGYQKHYENAILIHCTLTGQKPNNIAHLEEHLLEDFDILNETFEKMFKHKIDRTSFISSQYVLYQLLRKYNYNCDKKDFTMLKSDDKKRFHDEICGEMFAYLGWPFTPLY